MKARSRDTEPSFDGAMRALRRRSFAVLATADAEARPQSAGVVYALPPRGAAFYVMSRRHLQKARNVAVNRHVSLVVPLRRAVLGFVPPPCIQFQGTAELLGRDDADGTRAFESFALGRAILRSYARLERRGETRVCFLRIRPGPVMFAYAVGKSLWRLLRDMETGIARIEVPAEWQRAGEIVQ
jgi:Pyridoxamine 5'-phosphate oxidase